MIVLDASAAVSSLLNDGPARRFVEEEVLHAPHIALAEALDCTSVTADGRLGRAAGVRCAIAVVPN